MQHTIQITLDAGGKTVLLDVAGRRIEGNCVVKPNDEIQWVSPHGAVEVEFHYGTPFAPGVNRGGAKFQKVAAKPGEIFKYDCTITAPGGKDLTWANAPGGGGTVEVGAESRTGGE